MLPKYFIADNQNDYQMFGERGVCIRKVGGITFHDSSSHKMLFGMFTILNLQNGFEETFL